MDPRIIACEHAYYRCFCAHEVVPGGTRYRDAALPDMYDHNFTFAAADADPGLAPRETAARRADGADFCKLVLPLPLAEARALLGAAAADADMGELLIYSRPTGLPCGPVRADVRLRRYATGADAARLRAALLTSDLEQFEPDMHDFVRRRLARRERVYLAEGGVDAYLASACGRWAGSCDRMVWQGLMKLEDFNVRPALQRQGIGSAMLAALIAGARAEGVERAYLCTEADDTAWQMYEKFGFERAGAFTWAFWQL